MQCYFANTPYICIYTRIHHAFAKQLVAWGRYSSVSGAFWNLRRHAVIHERICENSYESSSNVSFAPVNVRSSGTRQRLHISDVRDGWSGKRHGKHVARFRGFTRAIATTKRTRRFLGDASLPTTRSTIVFRPCPPR